MAKSVKKGKPKPRSMPKTRPLTPKSLIAAAAPHSQRIQITCTFSSGVGQVTASLFRQGVLINMQSISSSGNIPFAEVQSGDVVSMNGVCTGSAVIAIDTPTTPATPEQFSTGLIIAGYLIN